MHTLCIRYTLDPNRLGDFKMYVENEMGVIRRSGGDIVGYFLPTDFAGATNIGYGLIDFPSLASYENYRRVLEDDPDHRRNAAELERSGAIVAMDRSIIVRASEAALASVTGEGVGGARAAAEAAPLDACGRVA